MQYYKYLDINYKPSSEKLLNYINNIRPDLLASARGNDWQNLNVNELLEHVPELNELFTPLGLTIHHMAFFISVNSVGTIHIDHDLHSKCRINIPVLNCENTETRFYKTLAEPIKVLQANKVPLLRLDPSKCILMEKFHLEKGAVVFRTDEPHQVISNNPNRPRISCTIGFNEDIKYLLGDKSI